MAGLAGLQVVSGRAQGLSGSYFYIYYNLYILLREKRTPREAVCPKDPTTSPASPSTSVN